jgi:hypothetical protein
MILVCDSLSVVQFTPGSQERRIGSSFAGLDNVQVAKKSSSCHVSIFVGGFCSGLSKYRWFWWARQSVEEQSVLEALRMLEEVARF